MSTYNRVLILGTLGQNPVLKNTQNGKAFCRMSLATDSYNSLSGESKTSWHNVHVFGKSAENVARYLRKGRQVFVEGRMDSTAREENGEKQWKTWITADRVTFLNGRPKEEDGAFPGEAPVTDPASSDAEEPAFPFLEMGAIPH